MRSLTPKAFRNTSASLLALGAALLFTGCSGGDKAVVEEITVEAASLQLSGADENQLSQHFVVKPRKGTEAQTLAALEALELTEAGGVTAGTRTIDGSTVSYTDWRAVDGTSEVTAERVVLTGVHQDETGATFDALSVFGMRATDTEETAVSADDASAQGSSPEPTVTARVAELVLIEPTPELAADISRLLRGVEERQDDAVRELSQNMDFRALRAVDFNARVDDDQADGTISVGQVVIGNGEDDGDTPGLLDMVVESVAFDWGSPDAPARRVTLDMDGMTALGVRRGEIAPGMSGMASLLSPSASLPYRSVDVGRGRLSSVQYDVSFAGFEAASERSGSVTTMRTVMEPMTVAIKDGTGTPLAPHMEVLRANGLSELSLKGSATAEIDAKADRVRYTDARFEIDEGLRLDCDYSVLGLSAAADALRDSGVSQPDFSTAQTNEDISRLIEQMEAYGAAKASADANIKVESGTCTVQDVDGNSLVERGYAVAAQVTGKPIAVLKSGAKAAIALGSLTARDEFQRGMMDVVGGAAMEFVDKPGQTLVISLNPAQPVPITSLRPGGDLPDFDALGLTATVN